MAHEIWRQSTLPHLGQSPLMVNSASSLPSSCAAASPFKRPEARMGRERSLETLFALFCGGGLRQWSFQLPDARHFWNKAGLCLVSCSLF